MTNSSGMPTTNDPTVANSTGPDWDLVPFGVPCARCGHDLRGLTDPVCPACQLEFDWSVAVPVEHLTCEKCRYHLFGLTETRCPECGERFTWELALAAYERHRHPSFEYRWHDQPFRSLIRTAYLTLRPRLLWQKLDIHDRPQVRPLIVMAALAHILMATLFPLLTVVYMWVAVGPSAVTGNVSPSVGNFFRSLQKMYTTPAIYLPTLMLATWSLLILGSLLLLRKSMKSHRVRSVQALRVWAHCVPVPASMANLVSVAAILWILAAGYRPHQAAAFLLPVAVTLYTCFLLQQGYKRYLKMPHAWGIAIATHSIGLLGAVIVAVFLGFLVT